MSNDRNEMFIGIVSFLAGLIFWCIVYEFIC